MKKQPKIYRLNTGGNCIISFRYTGTFDSVGCELIKVWDNFTDNKPSIVPVSKYGGSFLLGDPEINGIRFYISEFK